MKTALNTIAALIVATAMSACTNKSAEDHITSAQTLLLDGDEDAAVIELKNAVVLAPQSADVRLMLGSIYLSQSEYGAAEKELTRASELGANADQVIPLLTKLYYYQNDFGQAQWVLEEAEIESPDALSKAHLYAFLAKIYSSDDQLEQLKVPEQLIGDDRFIASGYLALAKRDFAAVQESISSFTETSSEPIEKDWLRGRTASAQQHYSEAVEALTKVVEQQPKLYMAKFQLADALTQTGQFDAAEKHIDDLLKVSKENAYANLLKANVRFLQKDYAEALPPAEKAVQNGMDIPAANVIAGISAFQLQRLEIAYRYLQRAAQSMPNDSQIHKVLAQTQLLLGYTNEAKNTLNALDDITNSADLFADTGMRLALQGDIEAAKSFLKKANEVDADNALNLLREGLLKIATADESGIANLEAAIRQDESLKQGWVSLAREYLQKNETQKALALADEWAKTDAANGLTLKSVILTHLNKPEEAKQALMDVLKVEPEHLGANQLLLNAEIAENDYPSAIAQAKNILTFLPDNFRTLMTLIRIGALSGQAGDIEKLLQAHMAKNPSLSSPLLALANFYRANEQPEKAISLLNEKKDSLDGRGWKYLGDSLMQMEDVVAARAAYKSWREKFPQEEDAWLRGIGAAEVQNDISGARELVSTALVQFPASRTLKLLRVNFDIKAGEIDRARRELELLRSNWGPVPYLVLLECQVMQMDGKNQQAATCYRGYYNQYPSLQSALLLANSLHLNGKGEEATTVFDGELEKLTGKQKVKATNAAAEFFSANALPRQAIKYYSLLDKALPNNAVVLNNLAWNQLQAAELDSALQSAKAAEKVAPESASVKDTLGWIYFKRGELNLAESSLRDSLGKRDSNNVKLHLAEVLIAQGQKQEAKTLLESIDAQEYAEQVASLIQQLN
ncbi:XrtA/PEP-CTERM system TPR-repeat protein PrsT [Bowmanella yangjiangensis]|uniref:PEP-CTERM system TPR-repeat protein PrsT n=1 Tax=Bowmanella yangjiangensis TaxID=2811230 RepID=A0ABS3CTE6_9ALTE|nr:XrtA/PEP-CTERM system TPR-repeat protein PrsT [Bowmanella yangjiangensis]MBN7820397.1 PEP-CTERM system TPR-repeat protein PrsT [Bowmanella yangjiangensis]